MNKIYKDNLRLMKNLLPAFYETVTKLDVHTARVCRTKNGKNNIIKKFKGKDLFIHSNYNPIEQAKAISEFALEEKSDIVFIFGLGLGYEVKEMIKKDYKKTYYIVEPDKDIFKTMLENIDFKFMTKNNKQLHFILNDDVDVICNDFMQRILEINTTSIKFVVLPSYQYIYAGLINKIFEAIKKVMLMLKQSVYISLGTAEQWSLNYVNNLQYLYETQPVSNLCKVFEGIPAVIVGAGPSLDENIEHLKKIYNKALIVTGGSAISITEYNEIKCHLAGAMDGAFENKKIYGELKTNKDISLIYSSQVYSLVPNMLKGHKFLLNQVQMDKFISEKMNWDCWSKFSGPSITNVLAYHLAKLGCNPIIFVGQDLCYSKQKLYAEGATYGYIKPEQITTGFISDKNVQGEEVYTDEGFISMKNSMEMAINANPSTKYLNGTKYGLHIEGAEDIDFNDYVDNVLGKAEEYDFQSIIDEKYNIECEIDKKEKVDRFINKVKTDLEHCLKIFRDIINFINGKETKDEKEKYILKKEKLLEKNEFFSELLKPTFYNSISIIFKEKEFLDMKEQIYCFYYNNCNSMNNNLEIILNQMSK